MRYRKITMSKIFGVSFDLPSCTIPYRNIKRLSVFLRPLLSFTFSKGTRSFRLQLSFSWPTSREMNFRNKRRRKQWRAMPFWRKPVSWLSKKKKAFSGRVRAVIGKSSEWITRWYLLRTNPRFKVLINADALKNAPTEKDNDGFCI